MVEEQDEELYKKNNTKLWWKRYGGRANDADNVLRD